VMSMGRVCMVRKEVNDMGFFERWWCMKMMVNVCDRCRVIVKELKDGVCEECFVSGWGVKKVSFLFRLKWDGGFVEKVFDNWSEGMKWVREGKGWLWNVGIESKMEVEKGF
jgi:hypothetical protein